MSENGANATTSDAVNGVASGSTNNLSALNMFANSNKEVIYTQMFKILMLTYSFKLHVQNINFVINHLSFIRLGREMLANWIWTNSFEIAILGNFPFL